ncbi:glycosyltransferase family 4 protein [Acinetobacter wuhouensis]|uniref:Glycosyltransferase family 4 protein n=1 Tax=Acinetobacter wuhouensis TaxID=1879050 RepID=A0A3G2SYM0_9GAMM|nr:glycosyltransferase family 4 protein [Acinetobacter wuhouensis]AYO52797.1 glycosyltransferase family 4 protein [Acinetobacter wuhouensis]
MRIVFFISNFNSSGGTERVTATVSNALCALGFEVHILSIVKDEKDFFYSVDPNVLVSNLGFPPNSSKKNFLNICSELRKYLLINKINNLIIVDSLCASFVFLATRLLKINVICWEHFNLEFKDKSILRSLGRLLASLSCNHIVTLTDMDQRDWEKKYQYSRNKVSVIPNPIAFDVRPKEFNQKKFIALSIGRLSPEKGFDDLITIWADFIQHNQDATLNIIGSGTEEKKLLALAEKYNLTEKNLNFLSSTKEIAKFYQEATVYLMSSHSEGLPMVLLEAQAFGVPIITFECGHGVNKIVKNTYNGYVVKNRDKKLFSQTLLEYANLSEEKINTLSKNSNKVASNYEIDKIRNLWVELLK